ncbi:MAG: beta-ketoacyl-[acyl-carrier-protein] synthase family protein [Actinomycetota bacterium]|nr:beta-ketoacyl-[acyl-carrier-protein] synthase family protein [Actinomycetota bacterium]
MMPSRRPVPGGPVVITGVGAVTPLGDAATTWARLLNGDSGLVPSPEGLRRAGCEVVGPATWFDTAGLLDRHTARRMGRFSQFSVVAARMAMADAGLEGFAGDGLGVVMHTGAGGLVEAEAAAGPAALRPGRVSPLFTPIYGANMAACQPSIDLGATGPVLGGVGACSAGVQAVIDGLRMLERDDAEVVLAGATDGALSALILGSLANAGALAPAGADPASACRPYDVRRTGMVASEGAAVFVLERLSRARERGARALAVVAGGGSAGDAHHLAAPHPEGRGAAEAMRRALADAGARPGEVDALVAHATATVQGDLAEARALRTVFGASPGMAVTAPKAALGHGLGAAGAFGVLVAVLSLRDGVLPATRGLDVDHVDPECRFDHVVGDPRAGPLTSVLVNAAGFGGQNAALLLRAAPRADDGPR